MASLKCSKCSKTLPDDSIFNICSKCMDVFSDEENYSQAVLTSKVKDSIVFQDPNTLPKLIRNLCRTAPDLLWDYEEGQYEEIDIDG